MTNADMIRSMNDEELCDYIYAIFLTGCYHNQSKNKNLVNEPLLIEWLKEER